MKKITPCFIIGILVLSGLGAVAIQEDDDKNILVKSDEMSIAAPTIREENNYVVLDVQDATQLIVAGKPMVPSFTKTFMFPVGTVIDDVRIDIDYQTIELDSKIQPSPVPVPFSSDVFIPEDTYVDLDVSVYESSDLYPAEAYTINYGVGINDQKHVTYVNVRCYAQYSPANDYIKMPSSINYDVEYTESVSSPFSQSAQDKFLIVTHETFKDEMLRLKEHKENVVGISTSVVTIDSILEQYTTGVADWENLKLYLADQVQFQGVGYVLFAGGVMGQTDQYWVPAFMSLNKDNAEDGQGVEYDPYYASDLYFADLFSYDNLGNPIFSTWDTNGNGIYAEGPRMAPTNYDKPDYIPDVYFGRLPLRYSWEAEIAVDKIIEFETTPLDTYWLKRAIAIGGDTSPQGRYGSQATAGIYESEIATGVSMDYLEAVGWDTYRMFMSPVGHPRYQGDHQLNNGEEGSAADEIAEEFRTRGAGWVHAGGHANPAVLGNHPNDCECFIYYWTIMDMNLFVSDGKYPFMVLDGCTNAFWDASIQRIISGGLNYPGMHGLKWIPTDATSWLVLKENGGGIGAIGNTALGYGYLNEAITQGLGGWIMPRFAHAYSVQGKELTGEIWAQGITDYVNNFDVISDAIDRKTIEQRQHLGDPTIRIGGVGGVSAAPDDEEESIKEDYVPAETVNSPTWNVGDEWTYNLNTIDFVMQEVEGRGIDLKLSAGTITLEVVESRAQSYVTEVNCDNIDVAIELSFDSYTEDPTIFVLPPVSFEDVRLSGSIVWEKDTLAIMDVDLSIYLDIMDNLDGLPIELPGFISQIISILPISIPVNLELNVDFENPWPLFQFPLEEGAEWGIPEGVATITIGGSVRSPWLRVISILNNFVPIIPPEFAQYLPNVDIAEVLEDFGVPSVMEIEIPYVGEVMRKSPFAVSGQETINVGAGSFSATRIKVLGGIGNMYYSDSVNNFVQISSPANDFLPAITNINLELIE